MLPRSFTEASNVIRNSRLSTTFMLMTCEGEEGVKRFFEEDVGSKFVYGRGLLRRKGEAGGLTDGDSSMLPD